jgi:hypothetical protein
VFPVRYELNSYILFRRNSVFKGLILNILQDLNRKYGPSYVNGVWRIKYNDELYNLFKEPNIVQKIKINSLKWLGNTRRMVESSLCKILTSSQPDDSRKEGRPKLRSVDVELGDLEILKVTA